MAYIHARRRRQTQPQGLVELLPEFQPSLLYTAGRLQVARPVSGSPDLSTRGTVGLGVVEQGVGGAFNGTDSGLFMGPVLTNAPSATIIVSVREAALGSDSAYVALGDAGSNDTLFVFGSLSSGAYRLICRSNGQYNIFDLQGGSVQLGRQVTVAAVYRHGSGAGFEKSLWQGARKVATTTSHVDYSFNFTHTSLGFLRRTTDGNFLNGTIALAMVLPYALEDAVLAEALDNPWRMFRPRTRRIQVGGGGGAATQVGATVAGSGSVAAAISTRIAAAAVSLGVGSVTAGISTSIPVAATVLGVANVAGQLSVQIRVAASVLGDALTAASLTTSIPVSAMVSGAGAMSAALSLGATISGQVLGDALVQAGIVTRIEVSAAVAGGGAVQASLGGTPAQVGAAVAGAGLVVGSITTQIPIAGAVLGAALVSGALEVSVPIGAVVQGVGYIQSGIDTAIQAAATVTGGGAVSARIEVAVVRISAPRQAARNTQHAVRSRAVQTSRRPRTPWH